MQDCLAVALNGFLPKKVTDREIRQFMIGRLSPEDKAIFGPYIMEGQLGYDVLKTFWAEHPILRRQGVIVFVRTLVKFHERVDKTVAYKLEENIVCNSNENFDLIEGKCIVLTTSVTNGEQGAGHFECINSKGIDLYSVLKKEHDLRCYH